MLTLQIPKYDTVGTNGRQNKITVLHILIDNNLYLKPQKCQFKATEVEYLRLIICKNLIAMDPVKVQGVKN